MEDPKYLRSYISKYIDKNIARLHFIYAKHNGDDPPKIEIRKKGQTYDDMDDWYLFNPPKTNVKKRFSSPPVLQNTGVCRYKLDEFIKDCCKNKYGDNISQNIMYIRYKLYCDTMRRIPCDIESFELELINMGYLKKNGCWTNLALA